MTWETDHHTPKQTPSTLEQARYEVGRILRWHTEDNGWSDIGYQYLVWDHYAIMGRGFGRTGAHAPGANSISVGIAFLLDGDVRLPTMTEWTTARAIMTRGVREGFVIPNYSVSGHRDWFATTCPSDNVYGHIHDPRAGEVELTPPPGHAPILEDSFMRVPSRYRGVLPNEEGTPMHTYDLFDLPADQNEGGEPGVTSYIIVAPLRPDPTDVEILWNQGLVRSTGLHVRVMQRYKVARRGEQGMSDYTTVRTSALAHVEARVERW